MSVATAEFTADEERWMGEALELAAQAATIGEAPIGAVVVLEGRIIGRGHNRREIDDDPTAHAEILALREASRRVARWRIDDATMVVTLEPCPMCAGALVSARIGEVIFGAVDAKGGALQSLYALGDDRRLNHRFNTRGGCRALESSSLLSNFFASLRAGRGRTRAVQAKSLRGF
jgi:tRNA(Arg) A34 adenosine deaminase TadA